MNFEPDGSTADRAKGNNLDQDLALNKAALQIQSVYRGKQARNWVKKEFGF
jgi:hypothetical protein